MFVWILVAIVCFQVVLPLTSVVYCRNLQSTKNIKITHISVTKKEPLLTFSHICISNKLTCKYCWLHYLHLLISFIFISVLYNFGSNKVKEHKLERQICRYSPTFRCPPMDLNQMYVKSLAYVTYNVNGSYCNTLMDLDVNRLHEHPDDVSGAWVGHWTISLLLKLGLFTVFPF